VKSLILTPAAKADMSDIWEYSRVNWGAEQADSYTDDIEHRCIALASGHASGRPVEVRPAYRKLPIGSHMIYFRESPDVVEVIRILHSRQDTDRHL
jgi:toxin ParE1/3/4